ncbi:hypothetical protein A3C23_01630 [Candidatus Roizmanbacteria bacterium RIFCSPHIGHO2_02_FULL_37_13b]|uniref:HTH cro/C1-type domain-containing protein n=1 Tax=Candidatus Roizmanbacteria bacterium RIFCSPLOWO2_02_FULL_36_11 TaxID=1802071 RepID=A0A1F7JC86_9BACT|nr:MAG: hypothetical protein A3C23_01630 [Candidatus Roizmanbacteria bacterium RIFCSPHIGHO2_02_FULL_37_13b]OGK53221.1 MAG: hypothetical protein A3H78_02675 [Candidatus Roizmanbacteria bacterium RIFCSPLOWO2_02_FULL_36_11]
MRQNFSGKNVRGNFIYKRLGQQLLSNRKKRGLSQEELSTLSHVDRTFIGRIEQGRANPSFKTVCKISRVLKVRMVELLKGF